MTLPHRTIRTLAALLVLTSALAATGIASPVAAQAQSNNSTTTNSSSPGGNNGYSPGSGDWSHWTNATNSTTVGGSGGFGIGPKEWAADIAEWLKTQGEKIFRWMLKASMSL